VQNRLIFSQRLFLLQPFSLRQRKWRNIRSIEKNFLSTNCTKKKHELFFYGFGMWLAVAL